MPGNFMTKMQAVSYISLETGKGRRVIENKMDELVASGSIKIEPDPVDKRAFRISRDDVEIVLRIIKGE